MTVPFMRAYTELLVKTCHRRGAHAIGGMAAVPNRRDPEVTEQAIAKVREDKRREAGDGCDGTWVAIPTWSPWRRGLRRRTRRPPQPTRPPATRCCGRPGGAGELRGARWDGDRRGLRTNVDVAIRYLASWLSGTGAAAIFNLMEDAATAEISRSQVWQWVRAWSQDGAPITAEQVMEVISEATAALRLRAR